MISLSNLNGKAIFHPEAKIIEIQPIHPINNSAHKNVESIQDEFSYYEHKLIKQKERLIEIKDQQKKILDETKEQIKHAKEQWEQEKNEWIEEAKQIGYEKGFEIGKYEALNQYKEKIQEVNHLIELAMNDYHETVENHEVTIVNIAILVAEKILRQQMDEKEDYFLSVVKRAITEMKNQPSVSLYLHPQDYETVLKHKAELKQSLQEKMSLSIFVDERLKKNSCIIEHPNGKIDASLDTQLSQIHQALLELIAEKNNVES